eukprot:gene10710-biopygen12347
MGGGAGPPRVPGITGSPEGGTGQWRGYGAGVARAVSHLWGGAGAARACPPPALASRCSWQAGHGPVRLWKDRSPIFPRTC